MTYLPEGLGTMLRGSFLANVQPAVVDQLITRARIREIPAGRVFIAEEHDRRCGLVVSGLARAYTLRGDGSQATQRRVTSGAGVGIHAMVGSRNRVRVQAITDVEFLELDAGLMLKLAREHSLLAVAIAEELDRRLADTELQLENVAGRVVQKIAAALLDMSVSDGRPLEVRISQERLAEAVGASRERVGHELRRLVRNRLIQAGRARFLILDPVGLQAVASGDPPGH